MLSRKVVCLALALSLTACKDTPESAESSPTFSASQAADTVFFGDHIITISPDKPTADAVAVRGDRIVFVGDRAKAKTLVSDETRIVELGDKALLPGFIDTHGHITAQARAFNYVNVSSPPVGSAEIVADIVALLKAHLTERRPQPGDWVVGYGYDDSLLAGKRHPARDDLDQVSTF